jgi:hypothetical protein
MITRICRGCGKHSQDPNSYNPNKFLCSSCTSKRRLLMGRKVLVMRLSGMKFKQIGEVLHVSCTRASQLYYIGLIHNHGMDRNGKLI